MAFPVQYQLLVILVFIILIDTAMTRTIRDGLTESSEGNQYSYLVSKSDSDPNTTGTMWLYIAVAGTFLIVILAICCCCNIRSQICLLKMLTPRIKLKGGTEMKFESFPRNCFIRCFYTFSYEIKDFKLQISGIDESPIYGAKRNLDQLYYQTPFRFIKLPNDQYIVRTEKGSPDSHSYEQRGLTEEEYSELADLPEIRAVVQADVNFNGYSARACYGENSWDSQPAELIFYTTCYICKGQSAILAQLTPKISVTDDYCKMQWYSELDTSMNHCSPTCEIELRGYTMTIGKDDSVNVTNSYELMELYEQYPFYCIKFNDGTKEKFIVREEKDSFRVVNACTNLSRYHIVVGKICASVIVQKQGQSITYISRPAHLEIYTYPCSICTNTGVVLEELKPNVSIDSDNDELVFNTNDPKLYKCPGCEVFVNDFKVTVESFAQFSLSKRKAVLPLDDLYKIFPFFCIKLPNLMFVIKRDGKAKVFGTPASTSYDLSSSPPENFHDYPHGAIAHCNVTTSLDLKCKQSFTPFACDSAAALLVLYSESRKK